MASRLTEERLERQLQLERLLTHVARSFIGLEHERFRETLVEALKQVGEALGSRRVGLSGLSPDGWVYDEGIEWSEADGPTLAQRLVGARLKDMPWTAARLLNHEAAFVDDLEEIRAEGPDEAALLEEMDIRSLAVLPIVHESNLIGCVGVDLTGRGPLAVEEVSFLCMTSGVLANAVAHWQTAKALKASEDRNSRILDASGDGICVIDAQHRLTFCNPRLSELLGIPERELLGKRPRDFIGTEKSAVRAGKALRAGRNHQTDLEYKRPDGSDGWLLVSAAPLFEEADYQGCVMVFADITDRKRAEVSRARMQAVHETMSKVSSAALRTRSRKALLRQVCDAATREGCFPIAWVLSYDQARNKMTVVARSGSASETARLAAMGRGNSARLASVFMRLAAMEVLVLPSSHLEKDDEQGTAALVPIRKQGHFVEALCVCNPRGVSFEQGELDLLKQLAGDLALALRALEERGKRQAAERGEKRLSEMFDRLIESSPMSIVAFDRDGLIQLWNPAAERLYGWKAEELLGLPNPTIPPESTAEYLAAAAEVLEGEQQTALGQKRVTRDGRTVIVDRVTGPLFDKHGRLVGTMAFSVDVTEQYRMSRVLEEVQRRMSAMFLYSPTGILLAERGGDVLEMNDSFASMLGICDTAEVPAMVKALRLEGWVEHQAGAGGEGVLEVTVDFDELRAAGVATSRHGKADIEAVITMIERVDEPPYFLCQAHDVSQRKSAEAEARRHHARLRQLAAELARAEDRERRSIATELHDRIGQALIVSKMKVGTVLPHVDDAEVAGTLRETVSLLDRTIQDTKTLTFEVSPPILYELGLEAALDWLAELISARQGIAVTFASGAGDVEVGEDVRAFIFRAVRELLLNVSKHASAEWAEVTLDSEGPDLKVEVVDGGCGFDVEAVSKGTGRYGFGLFSIRERLEQMGGGMTLRSKPGQGTRVEMRLPLDALGGEEA